MFIREQMINSIYDLKRGLSGDEELLDIYINSPRTCRWQNWTFDPGPYRTLPASQQATINNLYLNAGSQLYFGQKDRAARLTRAASELDQYYRGRRKINQLPTEAHEFMTVMPAWGTYGT